MSYVVEAGAEGYTLLCDTCGLEFEVKKGQRVRCSHCRETGYHDTAVETAQAICDFLGHEAEPEELEALAMDLETIYREGWNDAIDHSQSWIKTLKKETP